MAFQDSVVNGVELTRENFRNPPLEMGIVPFWFWNGDLEYEEMEWQLRQYHDRGVRSLFIHGRMGLNVPYLSPAWFDRVKFVVEKAKEIGIDTWVYDEMDWPSGTANKEVLKANPDLSQRYLELVALHIDGPIFTFLEAHDDRYVNTGNSNPIAAYGVRQEEYATTIREVIDLNKNLSWEKTLPWEAPEGKWVLMYFLEKQAPYYIDTLNPASTEKFLDLTHERYRKAVGHEFGHGVPGFFTDEPAIFYYHVGLDNYVVPWSKQMFKIFRDRRGYDLRPHLPALYADVGESTYRIRYDFWRTLTEQYADTYYKRIRDWCDENGVIFTGHLLFEEYLRLSARCEGNMFKYLQHMHLIGVDHLYPKIGTPNEPDQHVALKVGSSAAHHFGSTRLLCESMGGTYWDCTLERMKWMNNWEYVLGVNLFNNHGYHYTIEGERKRDWPPSQFYHHTWWKHYDWFTRYNARLSHVLSGGSHVAKVLMLYPINSIWTNYTPQKRTAIGNAIEGDFQYLTDTLLRLHYDFDYVDEDVLADAEVSDGKITIRDESYSVFLLPPVTHIKASTLEKLQVFVASGGSVISCTFVPIGLLDAASGDGALPGIDSFFGIDPVSTLREFSTGSAGTIEVKRPEPSAGFFFLKGRGLSESKPRDTLRDLLNQCAAPDVEIDDDDVFYLHRVKDGFHIYFVTNTSRTAKKSVHLSFEQAGRPEVWNPTTGETTPAMVYEIHNGRTSMRLDFPPSESYVIVFDGTVEDRHVTESNLDITEVSSGSVVGFGSILHEAFATVVSGEISERWAAPVRPPLPHILLPDSFDFRTEEDNVLTVGEWRMRMEDELGDSRSASSPFYADRDWLRVTNGAWEMQLLEERVEQVYPVKLWYRTTFQIGDMPSRLSMLIDGFSGSEHELFINGAAVEDEGTRSWLDAEIRSIDVLDFVRPGANHVAVRLTVTRRTDGMLDLLKLVGDFSLSEVEGVWAIVTRLKTMQIGDWTKQGLPFFSGTGVYKASIEIPAEYLDGGRVSLEADCGEDVLEVVANGGQSLIAPWHPYRLEVTEALRPGRNDFEIRVTNTLINILEGEAKASGLFSAPRLVHEHRYDLAK
ncbi:MAG TPA: glycosyl hydrolase [Rhodothermales bacterium]